MNPLVAGSALTSTRKSLGNQHRKKNSGASGQGRLSNHLIPRIWNKHIKSFLEPKGQITSKTHLCKRLQGAPARTAACLQSARAFNLQHNLGGIDTP